MSYKHILIASGGAEHSRRAEKRAVDLAKTFEAELSLLSVVRIDALPMAGAGFEVTGAINYAEIIESRQQLQAEILAEASERCERRGVKPASLLRGGDAGKQIVATAKELDCGLIIVGSRKLSMVSAIALGSVSDYVVRHAEADVLVVH